MAEKIGLNLTEEHLELLEVITDFNIEARYPDEKFAFKKRATKDFTEEYIKKIKKIKKWLMSEIWQ